MARLTPDPQEEFLDGLFLKHHPIGDGVQDGEQKLAALIDKVWVET